MNAEFSYSLFLAIQWNVAYYLMFYNDCHYKIVIQITGLIFQVELLSYYCSPYRFICVHAWWAGNTLFISYCVCSTAAVVLCMCHQLTSKFTVGITGCKQCMKLQLTNKHWSCLVAGMKTCWKELNTQAVVKLRQYSV